MDFVSHVKVLEQNSDNSKMVSLLVYSVEHLDVFKKPHSDELPREIKTPSLSGFCGARLKVGEEYLLGGMIDNDGVANISLCGLNKEWNALEPNEKEELATYRCERR
ncbi:hypothetical protein NECAME_14664 [Necator americanus]|uniref:NTR domain-containing protein n=1 Tax=Necator americanus TaxID=51031 RepID=W2SLM0_NECAM|nr:hypothetical protein NECAME_14664 [Necator americanus]ETN70569.1 hypothetical protein NECAME_14664 [Necator americanus]